MRASNSSVSIFAMLLGAGVLTAQTFPAPPISGPQYLADATLVDLNGDSRDDLVSIVDPPGATQGTLNVALSTGSGFALPATQSISQNPIAVAAADMNGDGNADIVIADSFGGQLDVFLGDGLGGLNLLGTSVLSGAVLTSLDLVDATADGNTDAVLSDAIGNFVVTLPGDGLGGFGPAVLSDVGAATGAGPRALAPGDFNNDGNLDVAVALSYPANDTTIWLGISTGAFFLAATLPNSNDAQELAVIDQDLDGNMDLVGSFLFDDEMRLYLGDGTGFGFTGPKSHGNLHGPAGLAVTDINSDGRADLLVINTVSADLAILMGTASFPRDGRSDATYAVDVYPVAVATGDVNGDGVSDALTANSGLSGGSYNLFFAKSNGVLSASQTEDVGGSPAAAAIGDINNDGMGDWVVANSFTSDLSVFLGDGSGAVKSRYELPLAGAAPGDVALDDLDLDGNLDLIVAQSGTGGAPGTSFAVLPGLGTGRFGLPLTFNTGGVLPRTLALGDLNNDGRTDVLTANLFSGDISVLLKQAAGFGFQAPVQYTVTSSSFSPYSIAVGDLNSDGDADLAIGHNDSTIAHLTVLYGTGSGAFDPVGSVATFPTVGFLPIGVALGDLDNDGDLDMASANFVGSGSDVSVSFGDGSGGFSAPVALTVEPAPFAIRMADFDQDGVLDLATANTLPSHHLAVIRGDGTGGFARPEIYSAGARTQNLAVGNLNGDGKADAIGVNYDSSTISIHLSR